MSKAPSPRWYRSLYWRMGLGLFAFLALMLAAQGALLLWLADRMAGSMPATSPQRLADLVASDIGTALGEDPAIDLQVYVREHYDNVFQSFVVVMRDGRTVANHDDLPENVREGLRAEALRRPPPNRRFPTRGFGAGRGGRQGAGLAGPPRPGALGAPRGPLGSGRGRGGVDQGRGAAARASLPTIGDFAPIAVKLGYDPIAFAIIGIIAIEAGLLTPPFGLLVYTVKSSIQEFDPDLNVMAIFKSSTPYWIIMLIGMVVIINFPEIATYLPKLLFNTG